MMKIKVTLEIELPEQQLSAVVRILSEKVGGVFETDEQLKDWDVNLSEIYKVK